MYFAAWFYAKHWLISFIKKKIHQFSPGEQLQVFFPEQPIYVSRNQNRNGTHPLKTNVPWLEIALIHVTPSLHCEQRIDLCHCLEEKNKWLEWERWQYPFLKGICFLIKKDKNGIDLYFTRKLSLINEHNYIECSKAMKFRRRASRVRWSCLEHSCFLF